jgi:hypothetical protein
LFYPSSDLCFLQTLVFKNRAGPLQTLEMDSTRGQGLNILS